MVDRVYDPTRGIVPVTPQQNFVEWILGQVGNAVTTDVARANMVRAQRAAGPAGQSVPPAWASGASDVPLEPITATPPPPAGLPPLIGPPAPMAAGGPTQPGMTPTPSLGMPDRDRDRGLPPLGAPAPAGGVGPTGAIAGSSAQYPDETSRGLGSPAVPSLGGLGGIGGFGPGPGAGWLTNEGAAEKLRERGDLALIGGFQDAGIDAFKNPYAQRAIARYAPILGNLMDFFALASGNDPADADMMSKWVPQFVQQFMSGAINPQALVNQALQLASTNENLKQYFLGLGLDKLLAIQGATSGYGTLVDQARGRAVREKILRQEMEQQRHPGDPDVDAAAWIALARGGR